MRWCRKVGARIKNGWHNGPKMMLSHTITKLRFIQKHKRTHTHSTENLRVYRFENWFWSHFFCDCALLHVSFCFVAFLFMHSERACPPNFRSRCSLMLWRATFSSFFLVYFFTLIHCSLRVYGCVALHLHFVWYMIIIVFIVLAS